MLEMVGPSAENELNESKKHRKKRAKKAKKKKEKKEKKHAKKRKRERDSGNRDMLEDEIKHWKSVFYATDSKKRARHKARKKDQKHRHPSSSSQTCLSDSGSDSVHRATPPRKPPPRKQPGRTVLEAVQRGDLSRAVSLFHMAGDRQTYGEAHGGGDTEEEGQREQSCSVDQVHVISGLSPLVPWLHCPAAVERFCCVLLALFFALRLLVGFSSVTPPPLPPCAPGLGCIAGAQ